MKAIVLPFSRECLAGTAGLVFDNKDALHQIQQKRITAVVQPPILVPNWQDLLVKGVNCVLEYESCSPDQADGSYVLHGAKLVQILEDGIDPELARRMAIIMRQNERAKKILAENSPQIKAPVILDILSNQQAYRDALTRDRRVTNIPNESVDIGGGKSLPYKGKVSIPFATDAKLKPGGLIFDTQASQDLLKQKPRLTAWVKPIVMHTLEQLWEYDDLEIGDLCNVGYEGITYEPVSNTFTLENAVFLGLSNPVEVVVTPEPDKEPSKLTASHIESLIIQEEYYVPNGSVMTTCYLTLKNGFVVTGEDAPANPAIFDAEIGRESAKDNAMEKVWPFEAYLLKQRVYEEANT